MLARISTDAALESFLFLFFFLLGFWPVIILLAECLLQPTQWLIFRRGLLTSINAGQQYAHHPFQKFRVFPEDMECLIEQLVLVVPVDEHRVQRPVKIRPALNTYRHNGIGRVDDFARPDWQTGGAKHPPEMHDIWCELVVIQPVQQLHTRSVV